VVYMNTTENRPGYELSLAEEYAQSIIYRRKRFEVAKASADNEKEQLKNRVVMAVLSGHVSEAEAARLAGITRMTVRAWVGK
jgi:hypothetical protein